VERLVAVLRRRVGGAAEWRVVWGDDEEGRMAEALEVRRSRSLFGAAAAVLVRRAEGLRAANEALLEEAAGDAGAEGLLVVAGGVLDRRKRWYTAVRPHATEFACAPVGDPQALRAWTEWLADERTLRLAAPATAELIDRCGGDLGLIDSELEKLSVSGVAQPVTVAAVRERVAGVRAHAIEELTDRLAAGDRAGALRVLRGLLAADEPPLRIVGFLAANVRRALHVAEERERGASVAGIATALGMPEWLVRRQMGRGSATRLEAALAALAALDLDLKRSRPEAAVFEAALDALVSAGS
jgi:DNA polymerase-3 subunit delta